jgi:hypothetical protein
MNRFCKSCDEVTIGQALRCQYCFGTGQGETTEGVSLAEAAQELTLKGLVLA